MTNKQKALEFADETYKIAVEGRHVDVTSAMKDYAIEKLTKIERFSDQIIEAVITMDIQKLEHRVDIVLKVGHTRIKSHATSTDMYVSVDMAIEKIKQQLQRWKEKLQKHHTRTRALGVVDMRVNVFKKPDEANVEEINADIEEENQQRLVNQYQPHSVIETKSKPLKILTIDEAIMKMELSGDPFMIYRDEESQKIRVIYRTKIGDYGVIQPE